MTEMENRKISNADKADNYEKKLFDGSITSHKEIDDLTREVKELREQDGKLNRLINEIKPKVEQAEKEANESTSNMAKLKEIVLKKQEKAKVEHAELEKQFKALKPERDALVKNVSPVMLREYQAAIKKTGNTGLALINEEERCECLRHRHPGKDPRHGRQRQMRALRELPPCPLHPCPRSMIRIHRHRPRVGDPRRMRQVP